MNKLISRFRTELLNAAIDLGISRVVLEDDAVLRVTAKSGGIRLLLAALFGIPCLLLLYNAVASPALLTLLLALIFCPVLAVLTALFGFTMAEKSFDRSQRLATKSLHLFTLATAEAQTLPLQGVVQLSCKIVTINSGSHRRYTVAVHPGGGFEFTRFDSYTGAIAFAEQLAQFLSYELENSVEARYRLFEA